MPVPALGLHPRRRDDVTYTDGHDKTYAAGDAFYMPPGHAPSATAGTEFVTFRPKDQLAITDAAIAANVQEIMDAMT